MRRIASKNCLPTTHKFKQVRMARGGLPGDDHRREVKSSVGSSGTHRQSSKRDILSPTKVNPFKDPRGLENHLFTHVTSYSLGMTRKFCWWCDGQRISKWTACLTWPKKSTQTLVWEGESQGNNICARVPILCDKSEGIVWIIRTES